MKSYADAWEDIEEFFGNLYLFPDVEELFECDYGMSSDEKIELILSALGKWRDMCG